MTDEPMFPLAPRDRIYITGGQYRDYRGTIREIKTNAHVVEVDGVGIRHIQVGYCNLFLTEAPVTVSSMMLPATNDDEFPQLGDRVYLNGGLYTTGQKGAILNCKRTWKSHGKSRRNWEKVHSH
jgi:ribosomal protein L24